MKRSITIYLAVLFIATISSHCYAQAGRKMVSIHYSGGLPLQGLEDFISDRNFDGLNVDFRYFVDDKLSIGAIIGGNDFKRTYPRQTYTDENGSISSVRTNYFQSSPLLLTGHLYLASGEARVNPYIGLGAGVYLNNYARWDGTFSTTDARVNFGFKPEAGILIKVWRAVGISLKAGYNYNFYSHREIKNVAFLQADGGISLRFW